MTEVMVPGDAVNDKSASACSPSTLSRTRRASSGPAIVVGAGVGGSVGSSFGWSNCASRVVGTASCGWGSGRRGLSRCIAPVSRAPTFGLGAGGGNDGGGGSGLACCGGRTG